MYCDSIILKMFFSVHCGDKKKTPTVTALRQHLCCLHLNIFLTFKVPIHLFDKYKLNTYLLNARHCSRQLKWSHRQHKPLHYGACLLVRATQIRAGCAPVFRK